MLEVEVDDDKKSKEVMAELKSLAGLKSLRVLTLHGAIRSEDFVALKEFPQLTALTVRSKDIGNNALKHIAGLDRLTLLGIGGKDVSRFS